MKTPLLTGLIDRRILLNFRAAPEIVTQLLPKPFRAQLVQGEAIVGICLIRLRHERIKGLPAAFGLASENGAHRLAVEWEADGQLHRGVYIPRRDTSSAVNALLGSQLLGLHYHSTFSVEEAAGRYAISFRNADGTQLAVAAPVSCCSNVAVSAMCVRSRARQVARECRVSAPILPLNQIADGAADDGAKARNDSRRDRCCHEANKRIAR